MIEAIRDFVNIAPLTMLKNRHCSFDEGEQLSSNDSPGVSVAMLGLNHFKSINDIHGHIIDDERLEALG